MAINTQGQAEEDALGDMVAGHSSLTAIGPETILSS
jgi:hypothetical protein